MSRGTTSPPWTFDLGHARKVLAEFGRAFGRLSADPAGLAPEQERFLDQAVARITGTRRVFSMRLSRLGGSSRATAAQKTWPPRSREAGG